MPSADPSVLPAAVLSASALFTVYFVPFVAGAIALITIVVVPVFFIRMGLETALRNLNRIFGTNLGGYGDGPNPDNAD